MNDLTHGLKVCISNKFSGDAEAAGPGHVLSDKGLDVFGKDQRYLPPIKFLPQLVLGLVSQ